MRLVRLHTSAQQRKQLLDRLMEFRAVPVGAMRRLGETLEIYECVMQKM